MGRYTPSSNITEEKQHQEGTILRNTLVAGSGNGISKPNILYRYIILFNCYKVT